MELPDRAKDVKMRLEREKEGRRLLEEEGPRTVKEEGSVLERKAKEIWMGGETEGWKERRLKEEQEKIDNGEGYGTMIVDQIKEVWNQGEKKAEEVKVEDERYLKQKRRMEEFPKIGKD